MNELRKAELWNFYSSVWRNVLVRVLEWPPERAEQYIQELQRELNSETESARDFGFFYDPPSRFLFRPILGNGLHERLMESNSDQANPAIVWRILTRAIIGGRRERRMEEPTFDWVAAHRRYQRYRRRLERWLEFHTKK